MPELPEVQTVANQLHSRIAGRTIRRVEVRDTKRLGPGFDLAGMKIKRVCRVAKRVVFELVAEKPKRTSFLGVHLRMTGRLVWQEKPEAEPADSSLRVRFICDKGELQFLDTRRFGTITVAQTLEALDGKGIDPMTPDFTVEKLAMLLAGGKGNIKSWLLRQDKIAGIGNIYASEILFDCAIAPSRVPSSLKPAEIKRLRRSTVKILARAIDNCGTTFSDFQDSHGLTGSYQRFLKVYQREGLRCRRCKQSIKRVVQQQRSTFFCGGCQR